MLYSFQIYSLLCNFITSMRAFNKDQDIKMPFKARLSSLNLREVISLTLFRGGNENDNIYREYK